MPFDNDMPDWAQRAFNQVYQDMETFWTRPLVVFTVATMPSATDGRWLWRPFVVSDGAGNKWVAISNGTTIRYLEGTAA